MAVKDRRSPALRDKMDRLKVSLIREDGRLERLCEHGVGHTVGHVNHAMIYDKYMWVHGCCMDEKTGKPCCTAWPKES